MTSTPLAKSSAGTGLTFVDILPKRLDTPQSKTAYEPFPELLRRANERLQMYNNYDIITCEVIEVPLTKNEEKSIDSDAVKFTVESSESENVTENGYIRGLRLWMVGKTESSPPSQQIACFTEIPKNLKEGWSTYEFETLDTVISRINNLISDIPGRIINVQTQRLLHENGEMDPDSTYWTDKGGITLSFVYVIRIFFEIGEAANELIGIMDFAPSRINSVYEPFSMLVERAAHWCDQNKALRLCNAQTVRCKVSDFKVDSRRMHHSELYDTKILQVLRISYTKLSATTTPPPAVTLTSKMFLPRRISSRRHEGRDKTRDRITTWIKATGAKVLNVETMWMFENTGNDSWENFDSTFTDNSTDGDRKYMMIVRVYLDGTYDDPPAVQPAPIQVTQDEPTQKEETSDCCVIL